MRKLFRTGRGRKLAGVCSGLGEYLGIDPVLVRTGFVVLTITGGIGLVLYFVIWVMVPMNDFSGSLEGQGKKLVLSNKEKKIAGVCAGFGNYFDIDPTLFRIVFVLLVFAGGSGILVYLILWMVMPSAGQEFPDKPV